MERVTDFFKKNRNKRNSLRRCACYFKNSYFFEKIHEFYVRNNQSNLNFRFRNKSRRSNREKVVGKRKGKNRARKERKFFSLGAQPGFFAEEEEQWSG